MQPLTQEQRNLLIKSGYRSCMLRFRQIEFWQAATDDGGVIAIGRNGQRYYTEENEVYTEHSSLEAALGHAYVFGGPTPQTV